MAKEIEEIKRELFETAEELEACRKRGEQAEADTVPAKGQIYFFGYITLIHASHHTHIRSLKQKKVGSPKKCTWRQMQA